MIALLDCNNFYVSCERLFNPKLINKPVVVLSNNDGCIISRSNEAKDIGIKMGTPLFKIRHILKSNKVKILSSNYSVYGDISNRIMNILKNDLPEVEVYSIDEAFFSLYGVNDREKKCLNLADKILKWIGIPVSIGIANTKTLAKVANRAVKKKHKYVGFDFRYENVLELRKNNFDYMLKNTGVEDIWGVGKQLSIFLKGNNIKTAYDLSKSNDNFIREKKGVILQRTVFELRGIKCNYIESIIPVKKSICVSRSFGNKLKSYENIRSALIVYVQKAASKMRLEGLFCKSITIFLKTPRYEKYIYSNSKTYTLIEPTFDLRLIWKISDKLLLNIYKDSFLYGKVGVILSDFYSKEFVQQSLINQEASLELKRKKGIKIMKLIDNINYRFGYGKIKLSSDSSISFLSKNKEKDNKNMKWQMKSQYRSPCYTTSWCDIPKVKA